MKKAIGIGAGSLLLAAGVALLAIVLPPDETGAPSGNPAKPAWPEIDRPQRMRGPACIPVYSGCIPGTPTAIGLDPMR